MAGIREITSAQMEPHRLYLQGKDYEPLRGNPRRGKDKRTPATAEDLELLYQMFQSDFGSMAGGKPAGRSFEDWVRSTGFDAPQDAWQDWYIRRVRTSKPPMALPSAPMGPPQP